VETMFLNCSRLNRFISLQKTVIYTRVTILSKNDVAILLRHFHCKHFWEISGYHRAESRLSMGWPLSAIPPPRYSRIA
jgi:hypothetical protein